MRSAVSSVVVRIAVLSALGAPVGGAFATTPPESYPLGDADPAQSPVDPNLQAWLDQHVERPSPLDMTPAEFDDFVSRQDLPTRLYLKLARANRAEPPVGVRPAIEAVYQQLAADSVTMSEHPLMPFIDLEIAMAKEATPDERAKALQSMALVGAGSCAEKRLVYEDISKDSLAALSDDALRDLLSRIDAFRSVAFKRSALRKFVAALPDNRQRAVGEMLVVMAQPHPAVVAAAPWLKALGSKAKSQPGQGEPYASFDEARKLAGKRQCGHAKTLLVDALAGTKDKSALDEAVNSAKAVDGCYRRRDSGLRRDFWKQLTQRMSDTFGFGGWAESLLRLGYIHWTADEFDQAKPLFEEVAAKAKGREPRFEARAVFALGRVAEDQNESDNAIGRYKDYISRFPKEENYEEAMMSLVLLYADRRDWAQAVQPLESYIQAQTEMPVDDRSVSGMSFALFWAGRIYLESGNLPLAREMWRRVASEYYSTYYGAIGHYVLEKSMGHPLALQPSHTPTFRMHDLREAFLPQDRARVRRVEALMRLGMHSDAVCELEEIDTADGRPEKLLLRSIMLYASGRWLEAIKAYDALPRGFRNGLPVGFERMLFPRRFGTEIEDLAKKAGVDPDLVLAIIRQESVFNPQARSPVGAMGLMQLMPATARLEVKKLTDDYLPADERRLLRQRAEAPLNLLTAETNLAIGVHHVRSLLDKYKSPVYVLSAYNASPSAAARWQSTIPTKDLLTFIEKIPYKETRAYVKLVLRNYFYYKRWYNTPSGSFQHLDAVTSPLVAMVKAEASGAPNH
jgi:tetratricopeptide (TPR) repeat protein